jgi:hypothetical protein
MRWPFISNAGAPGSNKRELNFLSPAFLIGLPLVAVPLVIHLLSRRQQKRISWGAMRFLKEAVTRKRRLWRLTDLLLLLLRTAVFCFFVFALARPLLPATWLGGSTPREIHFGARSIHVDVAQGGGHVAVRSADREGERPAR